MDKSIFQREMLDCHVANFEVQLLMIVDLLVELLQYRMPPAVKRHICFETHLAFSCEQVLHSKCIAGKQISLNPKLITSFFNFQIWLLH